MEKLDLSIVIVNFNTSDLTKQCIDSVVKYTDGIKYEIIVVDNGSREKFTYSKVQVIKNKENFGFAKANNQGIAIAKGKFILLLNSDTIVNSNAITKMVEWMEAHKKIGISSCNLLNEDGSIQGTGGHFPTLFKVFCWMFFIDDIPFVDSIIGPFHPSHQKSFYKGTNFYSKERDLDWVTGAFMLIKKEVVDSVGLLDEEYFMYMEDVDYCFRAKRKGYGVYFLPKYEIVHLGGKSSNKEFPITSEISVLKMFYKKHYPTWKYPILRIFLKGGMAIRAALLGSTYVKAYKTA